MQFVWTFYMEDHKWAAWIAADSARRIGHGKVCRFDLFIPLSFRKSVAMRRERFNFDYASKILKSPGQCPKPTGKLKVSAELEKCGFAFPYFEYGLGVLEPSGNCEKPRMKQLQPSSTESLADAIVVN